MVSLFSIGATSSDLRCILFTLSLQRYEVLVKRAFDLLRLLNRRAEELRSLTLRRKANREVHRDLLHVLADGA
jgi:hypothetical protein